MELLKVTPLDSRHLATEKSTSEQQQQQQQPKLHFPVRALLFLPFHCLFFVFLG